MRSKQNGMLGGVLNPGRSSSVVGLPQASVAVLALVLTSCHPAGLGMSDTFRMMSPTPSSIGAAQPSQDQAGVPWWRAFNDVQLNDIVSRVEQRNLTVAQAREHLESATVLAASAASTFRPSVGVAGSAMGSTGKVTVDDISRRPVQLNLETGWEIALFGQDRMARQSADMNAAMAAQDIAAARLSVVAEAATSYVRLRALQQERRDADGLAAAQAKAEVVAGAKSRSGLGTRLEAQAAKDDVSAAAQQKLVLDAAIADEIQRIAFLQGAQGTDPALLVPKSQPQARGATAMAVPADLLRRRADVRRAEFAVLQAGADVGIAQADLLPKLQLSGTIGFGTPVSGSLFGVMGGPSLQLPIFDYGKRLAVVSARKAELKAAEAAFRQTVLLAYGEASAALRALQVARRNTTQIEAAYATAEKAKAAAELLSREGLVDLSKVIERQLIVFEYRQKRTEARKTEAEALITFARATGGSI